LIEEILEKYPDDVKIVYKNYPLSFHRQAKVAAMYALAAHKQGKWYEMYKEIFKNYKQLQSNQRIPEKFAEDLGLDMDRFLNDFNSTEVKDQVALEIKQLKDANVERLSIPKLFIDGREFKGKRNIDSFSAAIDSQLRGGAK